MVSAKVQQEQNYIFDDEDGMQIVLTVDLRCCEGCRTRICRSLKRIPGVVDARVGEDRTSLTVLGKAMEEEEILRRVRERKPMARILEVHIPLQRREAAEAEGAEKSKAASEEESRKGKKDSGGKQAAAAVAEEGAKGERKVAAKSGDTLVSERSHVSMGGSVNIRTRVTTTHDARTCLVLEETLFRIDKSSAAAAAATATAAGVPAAPPLPLLSLNKCV